MRFFVGVWMADLGFFYGLGFAFVVAGILVVVAAIILLSKRSRGRGKEKGKTETHAAGVIMIGPIPLVFGTDWKSVKPALALAVVLAVVVLVVYYWLLR